MSDIYLVNKNLLNGFLDYPVITHGQFCSLEYVHNVLFMDNKCHLKTFR